METVKDIKAKARELLKEGKASVFCEPLQDQPGRYICFGKVQNEDGKTYQEGSLIVQVKDEGDRVKIEALPANNGENNNTLVQHVILEHLKTLYDAEE